MLENRMTLMGPFSELRREMDRLFDNFGLGSTYSPLRRHRAYPALNVWDAGDTLCAEAEVPGILKDDLEVYAVGNELTIKGRRKQIDEKNSNYHRQERGTGEFARVLTLPVDVDADKVEAVLKDGVLMVRMPKAESAKPKQIAVKAS